MTFSLHADLPGKLASFGQKVQSLSGKRSLRSSLVSCSPSWSLFTDKSHLSFYGLTTCSAENLTKKPKKKQKKKSTLKATKYADSVFHLQEQTQDFDGAEIEKLSSSADPTLLVELLKEVKDLKARVSKLEKEIMSSSSSSSSSSSESSDSEREGRFMKMKKGRTSVIENDPVVSEIAAQMLNISIEDAGGSGLSSTAQVDISQERVEVCLGKKCRERGAAKILEELSLQHQEIKASACYKCMKKCKYAPNVRVELNNGMDSLVTPVRSVSDVVALLNEKRSGAVITA